MRTRLLIFDTRTGAAVLGMDGAHGDAHALRVVEQNVALLAGRGCDPLVVEFDVHEGGDQVLKDMGSLRNVALDIRELPDGRREVIDLTCRRPDSAGKGRGDVVSIARAVRVLHAGAGIANPRAQLHRRPRAPE